MFTGIIESLGKVISLKKEKGSITFSIGCNFASKLKKGQSVAHNGVCLTVENVLEGFYTVTAVRETLSKTNLGKLKPGNRVNLERSLRIGDRLDGHFVQGHVDTCAKIISIQEQKGSWLFEFQIDNRQVTTENLVVEKGSICINGVSLTVVRVSPSKNKKRILFSVAIIPHTFYHTNFSLLKKGHEVNIEFDIFGKYIQKIIASQQR